MVVRDPAELARVVWRQALARALAAAPSVTLGAPHFGPRSVTFPIRLPEGEVGMRVEPVDGGPCLVAGPTLQVVLEGPGAGFVDQLARRVVALTPTVDFPPPVRVAAPRLELFIVDGCTLSCSFCCESTRILRHTRMPWTDLEARLHAAADRGVRVVQFMGGEASLHPDFPRALALTRALGMGTYTITNLLRWEDRAFAEAVAPHLDEVMISLHAGSRDAGLAVTGRATWWDRFRRAARHARETLHARVKLSTVVSRENVDQLDAIVTLGLGFGPDTWVMGNPVPVAAARADAVDTGLRLDHQRALRPTWTRLQARCAAAGCRLVFFCVPHCVLGPELWDAGHDDLVDNQDLSDAAPSDSASTFFWSQADFLEQPRPVTLARTRPGACTGCVRAHRCGGYFADYFARHGDAELCAVRDLSPS